MSTRPARIVHISIDRDWRDVYAFASKPENMPSWASGLASRLTRDGDEWIADGGPIRSGARAVCAGQMTSASSTTR